MAWVGWGWFCPHLLDNPKSPWKNKKSDFLKVHNEWGKFKNLGTSRTLFSCFFQVPFHNLGLKFNLIAYLSLLCFKNVKLDTVTYCCTSNIFSSFLMKYWAAHWIPVPVSIRTNSVAYLQRDPQPPPS